MKLSTIRKKFSTQQLFILKEEITNVTEMIEKWQEEADLPVQVRHDFILKWISYCKCSKNYNFNFSIFSGTIKEVKYNKMREIF